MKKITFISVFFFVCSSLGAQTVEGDTLSSARIVSYHNSTNKIGTRLISVESLTPLISPTGEAGISSFVKTLPGVSMGAESSTSYYVRGSNSGNNVQMLDGIRIYGPSHTLGFSSAWSMDIVSDITFQNGGFSAEYGNASASFLSMKTKDPTGKISSKFDLSNFRISGFCSGDILPGKVSFMVSAGYSPLFLLYNKLGKFSKEDDLKMSGSNVYDVFAKLVYAPGNRDKLKMSVLHTGDRYSLATNAQPSQKLSWSNTILNLTHNHNFSDAHTYCNILSFNHFDNNQFAKSAMPEGAGLGLSNIINEVRLNSGGDIKVSEIFKVKYGLDLSYSNINPAAIRNTNHSGKGYNVLDNALYAMISTIPGRRGLWQLSGRLNLYSVNGLGDTGWQTRFDPEFSSLARAQIGKHFGLEASLDYRTQFLHSIEGIPLGWSMNLFLPSTQDSTPEKSLQLYGGGFLQFTKHKITLGYYFKRESNLLYLIDAESLFTMSAIDWRENLRRGSGTSRGIEFLYEKEGDILRYKLAYTWSVTDRMFNGVNNGQPFHSKFDRTHMLNADLSCKILHKGNTTLSLSSLFVFESGCWDSIQTSRYTYSMLPIMDIPVDVYYYKGVNNFQYPNYIRWDISANLTVMSKACRHNIDIGIYNVLNRHNPFSIRYDYESRRWTQISLFPILPTIHYSICF